MSLILGRTPIALCLNDASDLVAGWLANRSPRTLRAYRQDLGDFARFACPGGATGEPIDSHAVCLLLDSGPGPARGLAQSYRAHLERRRLAPATVNRRLASLRSLVDEGRRRQLVNWALEVEGPRGITYRDTRGPGLAGWRAILATAEARATNPQGRRNRAVVRLLHDLALRRGEVSSLDLGDYDAEGQSVAVLGKGKTERIRIGLTAGAQAAIDAWLADRGHLPGPLFTALSSRSDRSRLSGEAIAELVAELGKAAGITRKVRPHGLRHQAITRALEVSGGDIREVQKFSRHARLETIVRYDDNRRSDGNPLARRIAGED